MVGGGVRDGVEVDGELKEGKLKTTYHPTISPPWLSLRLFWLSSLLSLDRGPREQTLLYLLFPLSIEGVLRALQTHT